MLRLADRKADGRLARRASPSSSRSRTKGERATLGARPAPGGEWGDWRFILYIMNSGAARRITDRIA